MFNFPFLHAARSQPALPPMKVFTVTVTTEIERITYTAIARYAADISIDALDKFGACSVTVMSGATR